MTFIASLQEQIPRYNGYFLLELKRRKIYITNLIFQFITTGIRIILPASLFQILLINGSITRETFAISIWAVMLGQVTSSAGRYSIFDKIRSDIRSGDIQIRINEPVNYVLVKLAQSFGYFVPTFFSQFLFFAPLLAIFLPTALNIFNLLLFTFLAFVITVLIKILIGLSSFVIEESESINWISNKLMFIFGNQVIPLNLMPSWVFNFAIFTPFFLSVGAPVFIATGRIDIIQAIILYAFWIAVLMSLNLYLLKYLAKE